MLLKDAESGERAFLITGQPRFQKPHSKTAASLTSAIAHIRELTADNPRQQKRVSELELLIADRMAELKESMDLRGQKGLEAAQEAMKADEARAAANAIGSKISEIENEERQLLEVREGIARDSTKTANAMMFGGTALAVLVSGLISFILIRGMMASLHTALELAEKVEIGELTHRAKVNSGDELGRLIGSLNRMAEALGKTVMEVAAVSWNVSRGSEELSATAQKLAGGATEQAAAADETASAMEEMAASAQQNARQALQTDRIASKATEDARVSGNAVAQTLQVMREVAAKIGLIEEIARKTDLLALNAAIEAAPAGGIADSVHEVIELAPGDIDPGPGLGTRWRSEFIQGMAKHGEGFLLILDVNAVFSTQESAGASDLELESEG